MSIKEIKQKKNVKIKENHSQEVSLHKRQKASGIIGTPNLFITSNYDKCKRLADIVLSGTAIVVLSPLLIGISIAIKREGEGPVIFRQTRIGIHKSHFEIYKFRTMYADTPKDMPTHLLQNPDAMVTKTGAFLRKYSLDELPQLFNILRGDMSIVGPRPALWNQDDLIAERDKYYANDVLPGLTGWAQINGRDELEIPVKAKLDGIYVRHYGPLMDIRCLIGTIFAVAGHKGYLEGGTGRRKASASLKADSVRQVAGTKCDSVRQAAGTKCHSIRQASGTAVDSNEQIDIADRTQKLPDKPVKVLITGKNSYIGTAVREWLSTYGNRYEVTEISMHGDEWKSYDFSGYDTVFHVAGIAHADVGKVSNEQKQLYYKINRDLAVDTAQKAKSAGVGQFIYMSSMIVYGDSAPYGRRKQITAKTKPHPANFYGNSKWQGEQGVRALATPSFRVCILRPPMIYGKGSKGNYPMLAKLAAHVPVFPLVENERSMLHIDNLCEFVRLIITNKESGIFFPQNDAYVNTAKMVRMVAGAHGRQIHLVKQLAPAVQFASRMPGRIGQLANKAFGNFTYDLSMSEYQNGNYRVHNLEESITVTEK